MPDPCIEHLDLLIVGAGLSGLGAAHYLQKHHPAKSWAIVEARAAMGGTWDLFRYPGIRSDSDLYTYGYEFKPWIHGPSIAGAPEILAYLRETAAENGIDRKVRLQQRVVGAAWSSADAWWTVDIERLDTGEHLQLRCRWLFCAAGYYRYDQGHTPPLEGIARFAGPVVHPQHWPAPLDWTGKRVLVVGSGATAVTLVPALAEQAAHVTMLQRTPSYVVSMPAVDPVAGILRRLLPQRWAYALMRRKNIALSQAIWRLCRRYPQAARRLIRARAKRALPPGYPVDEHFNPPYAPWDQRLCLVPDGDLFKAISAGKASVVTDHIAHFTAQGVQLASGRMLAADIVVTATGLNLQLLGGMRLCVDGQPVDLGRKVVFRGMLLDGVPNLAFAMGYTNASWTLKIGLVCEHLCRLLQHMDDHGYATCRPSHPPPDMPTRPLLGLSSGYVRRGMAQLPRQGPHAPWSMPLNYRRDARALRRGPVRDPFLQFTRAGDAPAALPKELSMTSPHAITPRERLDFNLQGDIPRYWLGGDPFKTRFFDAMSITFPEGERYFISCVRDFADAVTDPELRQNIKDFTRQEGQHGMIHRQFNERLRAQGVNVDRLEGFTRGLLFGFMRRFFSRRHTLADTAACEHLTAIMARAFFTRQETMAAADPRVHAMYTWHAMEETEHKAVAFDVMQQVARVGYLRRTYTLIEATLSFNLQVLLFTFAMLKTDGFSRWQRLRMLAPGLWWVYGPRGVFTRHLRPYLRYFKPGFHPWNEALPANYHLWLETFKRTGDPLQAGHAVHAATRPTA
ncbi:MAG: metal-dependent hydrolase [Comamonas sp.]